MPNWREILTEITEFQQANAHNPQVAITAIDVIRRKYLLLLHQKLTRNVIVYYSGWLSKPGIAQAAITDEDKNGFMMAVHGLDRSKGLDLLLHTQGGSIAATQSIVNYLHKMFHNAALGIPDIRAIVPQIAMSAGTMLACACKTIMMAKHSNLGPIDPHLRDVPTYGVIREFRRACREVKRDSSRLAIWQTIIGQYRPTFLGQCENAVKWSDSFVREQLGKVMFADDKLGAKKAKKIVKELSDYQKNKVHDWHIHAEECEKIGLVIDKIEADPVTQDLILTVHHCLMHTLMNTQAYKIIENHQGSAIVKRQNPIMAPMPMQPTIIPFQIQPPNVLSPPFEQ
ncbi:MAG: SDH family Clp fold serine proteinase [Nitrososphaerales archaeon]